MILPSSLSDREAGLVRLAGMVLLVAVFFARSYLPCLKRVRAALDVRRELAAEKAEMASLLERASEIRREYDEVKAWTLSTKTKAEETAAILRQIEAMARPLRLRILSVKPLAPKKTELLSEHRVRIEAEGRLAEAVRFLVALQNAQSLLKTTELRLTAKTQPEGWMRMSLLVTRLSGKRD